MSDSRPPQPGQQAFHRASNVEQASHDRLHPPQTRSLLRARDLVDARYSEPLTVAVLAQAAGMSHAHFIRQFHKTFGETPHQYLLTRRMQRAAETLAESDLTVSDICRSVGLRSAASFSSTFSRLYGMTPTAYRAAHRPVDDSRAVPGCFRRAWTRPGSP